MPSTPPPSPFVATLCQRLGVDYGGWDTMSPLPPDQGGPGSLVTVHIDDGSTPPAREGHLQGTGIVRTARVYPDRTEVYDGDTLLARYDDLTVMQMFG